MKKFIIPLIASFVLPLGVRTANILEEEDLLTDQKMIWVTQKSSNTIGNSIGVQEKGNLGIQCDDINGNNTVAVALATPTFNSSDNQSLGIRFDKNPPESIYMIGSAAGSTFWITDEEKANKFVEKINNHSKLIMQWKKYLGGKQTLVFDLSDLKIKLSEAKKKGCNFTF